jgi:glutathione S-transferase
MNNMKLYYSKGACSLAIRITLHEAQVDFSSEAVNLKTKQTDSGRSFLEINPKEGTAIQVYLADHYGLADLLPPLSDFRRYRVLEWLNFVATDIHKSCGPLFNADVPEALREQLFRPLLRKKLDFIEQNLQKQVYLGGTSASLADNYLFVILRWLGALQIDIKDYPALTRYFNQMMTRPAVQKALQEEALTTA